MSEQSQELAPQDDPIFSFLQNAEEEKEDEANEEVDQELEQEPVDEESEDEESEEEKETEDPPKKPDEVKFKFKLRNDDAEEVEVTQEELINGYRRQSDYTRQMQSLSEREQQAVEVMTQTLEAKRQQYEGGLEQAQALLMRVVGFRSPQEMEQLKASDPVAWAQTREWQDQLIGLSSQIQQELNNSRQQATVQQQQMQTAYFQQYAQKADQYLYEKGLPPDKLGQVIKDAETQGFSREKLINLFVQEPEAALIMRDALAYRAAQKSLPSKLAAAKPGTQMPGKTTESIKSNERKIKESKLRVAKSGRAEDLDAFISQLRK